MSDFYKYVVKSNCPTVAEIHNGQGIVVAGMVFFGDYQENEMKLLCERANIGYNKSNNSQWGMK